MIKAVIIEAEKQDQEKANALLAGEGKTHLVDDLPRNNLVLRLRQRSTGLFGLDGIAIRQEIYPDVAVNKALFDHSTPLGRMSIPFPKRDSPLQKQGTP